MIPRASGTLFLAALLALSACTGDRAAGGGGPGSSRPGNGGTTRPGGGGAVTTGPSPGFRPGTTSTVFPSGVPSRNTIPLRLTLDRSCARPGDLLTATAVTVPQADVTFAAFYAQSQDPDYHAVPPAANTTGTVTWRWVIKPTTPLGEALLAAVAGRGEDGASAYTPFTVASGC